MFKSTIKEQLKVPAHIDYLSELRAFVTRVGRKHGVSDKAVNAFKLAIDEAGTNIIRHAYRDVEESGFILLRVIIRKASLTVSLIDQGKYFDLRSVKDPNLKRYVEIGKKGGLGIFIIRKLMDEIDYRKTEEGNELRLTKYRANSKSKNGVEKNVEHEIPLGIPLTLKVKYFIRTGLVVTIAIACWYLYLFVGSGGSIQDMRLKDLHGFGARLGASLSQNPSIPDDPLYTLNYVEATFKENENWLYEIVLYDKYGAIIAHSDKQRLLEGAEEFEPSPANRKGVFENIFENSVKIPGEAGEKTIYNFVTELADTLTNEKKGEVHVRIFKANIEEEIYNKRLEDAKLALFILLSGYAGALVLIYVLLNPFRRLSDWVRAMDHGDEVEDEMDIDTSTEIGEIAKAFSEITTKLRMSQKNLAQQEQLQKEMQVAKEIQQALLPSEFPNLEGYELASLYQAAKEVGGDYYDFVEVDKDTLGIVVADVSGKGVPGSLVMTMIRTALRTEARGVYDAAEVLARVNNFVVGDMKKGMFVTIFYVIIDSKRRRLNYASAGHNPMILYRPSAKKTYYLNPKGFPIGIQLAEKDLFRRSIESDTIQLAEDDILILYTDGITEAMNRERALFGDERLLKVIRNSGHLRVEPFVEKLKLEIESFTEGGIQYDDITLVSIKEKTSPEKEELRRAKLAHKAILGGMSIKDACEDARMTTYAYYNKYKKQFDEFGAENYEIDEKISVEAKHISVEDKTRVFDIIKNNPEFGAGRISEELNSEKYGFVEIPKSKVYEELVRSRLNTRQLREAYIARGGPKKRRMKPPGTPMLTLDGRVIIDRQAYDLTPAQSNDDAGAGGKIPNVAEKPPIKIKRRESKPKSDATVDMSVLSTPIEDLLERNRSDGAPNQDSVKKQKREPDAPKTASIVRAESDPKDQVRAPQAVDDVSFEDLFEDGGFDVDAEITKHTQTQELSHRNLEESSLEDNPGAEGETHAEKSESSTFSGFDDLVRDEILSNFEDAASNVIFEDSFEEGESFDGPSSKMEGAVPNGDVSEIRPEAVPPGDLEELERRDVEITITHDEDQATLTRAYKVGGREAEVSSPTVFSADDRDRQLKAGLTYYKRQEFDKTIGELLQTVRHFPDFKEAHSVLGNAWFRKNQFEQATHAYHRVLELDPSDATARENIGVICANQGKLQAAIEQWRYIIHDDPTRVDIHKKIERAEKILQRKPVLADSFR